MKKNFKMHSGFSVAELMITMLITMLIAAALVPVIGPRKIKNADPRHLHGIAECYWDQNPGSQTYGQLMYYYADNKEHKKAADQITKTVTDPGYCTFDVPKGTYFDIYAVGAGSRGTGLPENMELTTNITSIEKYRNNINLTNTDNSGTTSYSRDLSSNIVQHIGNHDNVNLIPGQNFDVIVRESVSRWADRINHMQEIIEAGGNPQEDDGSEIEGVNLANYNSSGEYLYAEFKGIRGPVGSGGAGYSIIPEPWVELVPGTFCTDICRPDNKYGDNPNCPESTYSAQNYVLFNDATTKNEVWLRSLPNGSTPYNTCKYYHLHAKGGDSASAIGFDSNTSLLLPIDGDSEPNLVEGKPAYMRATNTSDNELVDDGHTKLQISIRTHHGDFANNIQLTTSYPGFNSKSVNEALYDGCDGTQSPSVDGLGCISSSHTGFSNCFFRNARDVVPPKTLSNGTMSDFACTDMSTGYDGFVQQGMQHGQTGSNWGRLFQGSHTSAESGYPATRNSGLGEVGEFGLANNRAIFTWIINEPQAEITYTNGGNTGELRTLTFAHLRGPLYLKPGQNIEGTRTHTYVYTDKNDMAGSTILMAESPEDNIAAVALRHGTYTLGEVGNSPLPPQSILDEAYPDNQKFYAYIDAIRSVRQWGLSGGLIADCAAFSGEQLDECINRKYWPGYGGSGAFPMLNNDNFNYVLTLVNNQPYVSSYADEDVRRRYNRTFPRNLEFDLQCPEGYYDPRANDVPQEGQQIQHYCTAETEMRRDGAVIIVW